MFVAYVHVLMQNGANTLILQRLLVLLGFEDKVIIKTRSQLGLYNHKNQIVTALFGFVDLKEM